MKRSLIAFLAVAIALQGLVVPTRAANAEGAVTWTVDHQAKTITARVQLQIYSGCLSEDCAAVNSQAATEFIANKIKAQAEGVWNRGYFYRCYRFILDVHVKVGVGRTGIDKDRVGVMIDPSFAGIRDHVGDSDYESSDWESNDPSSSVTPDQEGSTWGEQSQYEATTYAHEIGHVLGLDDHYHDQENAAGETISVPNPGAPDDLMSTMATNIDQSTINRVIERNRDKLRDQSGGSVSLDDLECPEFMATIDGKQTDHKGTMLRFTGCVGTTTLSRSTDQTVIFASEKVHVDAAKLGQPHVLWPGLEVVLVPHGQPAASVDLNGGPSNEPTLFTIPATFSVDRANSEPGLAPMPSVLDAGDVGCAGGSPEGGAPPRSDCGQREYQALIAVTLSRVTVVLPQVENGNPDPASLYRNCEGPYPIPGVFAYAGGGSISGGTVPVAKLLDPNVDKIDISGSATFTVVEAGRYETIQYDWLLQLCRIRRGVPAC